MIELEPYYNLEQAAKELGVCYRKAREMLRSGELKPIEKFNPDNKFFRYHFRVSYIQKFKMSKHHRAWSDAEIMSLMTSRGVGVPFKKIANELGRTEKACRSKYFELDKLYYHELEEEYQARADQQFD